MANGTDRGTGCEELDFRTSGSWRRDVYTGLPVQPLHGQRDGGNSPIRFDREADAIKIVGSRRKINDTGPTSCSGNRVVEAGGVRCRVAASGAKRRLSRACCRAIRDRKASVGPIDRAAWVNNAVPELSA